MRATSILLSLLLASPAAAQQRDEEQNAIIVVQGASLAETRTQLDACLARRCPPKEDIEATLAHAENQFMAGDYEGSRRTLAKGHGRNARHARTLPVEVADLDRAYGRLTNLVGFPDIGRFLQIRSLDALKTGLDDDDSRVLMQRLMVGDEFAHAGRDRAAEDVYRSVARRARKAGKIEVQGHAMLREAVLYGAISSSRPEYRGYTSHKIEQIEKTREPQLAPFRVAAGLLRAQLALFDGDRAALDKAIAAIPPQDGKPLLVYSPPIVLDGDVSRMRAADDRISANYTRSTDTGTRATAETEWIDVRFRVAPDGTVRDVETLRDSGNLAGTWPRPVHNAVAARRYVPLPQGSTGTVRIERFSYVHDSVAVTPSRMRVRSRKGRITSLDITVDPLRS